MMGDVWEWTSTDFRAYPGYQTFPYPEYSEVFSAMSTRC
jgi:iron(II)-dependent oxidoreductase